MQIKRKMKQFLKLISNGNSKNNLMPARQLTVRIFNSFLENTKSSTLFRIPCKGLSTNCAVIRKNISDDTYKLKDEEYEKTKKKNRVIYYGGLTPQIKGLKVFTCTSSLGGLVIQPLIVQNILAGENLSLNVALGTVVGIFTFMTPFLIHLLTKKYVTEIKYDEITETYEATTLSFFLQKKNMSFKIEDVKIPDSLPLFTTMSIKGKPVFVVSDSFLVISHYIKMMGYDKPIDLKLNVPDNVEQSHLDKGKASVTSQGECST